MAFLGHLGSDDHFWAGRRCQSLCGFGLFQNAPGKTTVYSLPIQWWCDPSPHRRMHLWGAVTPSLDSPLKAGQPILLLIQMGTLRPTLQDHWLTQSHSTLLCSRAGLVPRDCQDLNTKGIHYGQNAPYIFSLLSPKWKWEHGPLLARVQENVAIQMSSCGFGDQQVGLCWGWSILPPTCPSCHLPCI